MADEPFPVAERVESSAVPGVVAFSLSENGVLAYGIGSSVQVSTNGGIFPRWRRDGRELFFMSQASGGTLMAVEVKSGGSAFERGTPKELFETGYINLISGGPYHTYAVSADGQRFLIPRPRSNDTEVGSAPIAVVLNWDSGIRK